MHATRRHLSFSLALSLVAILGAGCSSKTTTEKETTEARTKYESQAASKGVRRDPNQRTAGDPNVTGPPR